MYKRAYTINNSLLCSDFVELTKFGKCDTVIKNLLIMAELKQDINSVKLLEDIKTNSLKKFTYAKIYSLYK